MPKISIHERDLTTVSLDNVTDNIAYIPGYAITGPVNTPVLCYTLEEFQKIFGTLPYKFENSYSYSSLASTDTTTFSSVPSENFVLKDSYEKSYIMAAELLTNGLPILYERVMSTSVTNDVSNIDKWTARRAFGGLVIKAKYPGKYGKLIDCKVESITTGSGENITTVGYTITIKIDKNDEGIPALNPISYTISLDESSSNYYGDVKSSYIDISVNTSTAIAPNNTYSKLTINQQPSGEEFTPSVMYGFLNNDTLFKNLEDRGEYQVKFITSGGYPTFEYNSNSIVTKMLTAAGNRGDSIALIDHIDKPGRPLVNDGSVFKELNSFQDIQIGTAEKPDQALRYGAMFTPYAMYKIVTLNNKTETLPASFAYLNSLAVSVRTNANWYAIAGVTRGLVPNLLQLKENITGAIAESLQPTTGVSINPITNIKPYGYCIWGNRTTNKNENGLIASSFLNIRMLANDVKKVVYTAARKLTFELNTDVLWLNFKSEIEPILDKMVSGNGLTGYRILRKATTKRATIEAVIRLFVVEAVEDWDITIELSDTTVTVQ